MGARISIEASLSVVASKISRRERIFTGLVVFVVFFYKLFVTFTDLKVKRTFAIFGDRSIIILVLFVFVVLDRFPIFDELNDLIPAPSS